MQMRVKFHGSGNRQVCALCCKGGNGLFTIAAWYYGRFAVNATCPACVRLWGLVIFVRIVTMLQYGLQQYA